MIAASEAINRQATKNCYETGVLFANDSFKLSGVSFAPCSAPKSVATSIVWRIFENAAVSFVADGTYSDARFVKRSDMTI